MKLILNSAEIEAILSEWGTTKGYKIDSVQVLILDADNQVVTQTDESCLEVSASIILDDASWKVQNT